MTDSVQRLFKVTCEWKGATSTFEVVASNKDDACDIASKTCKATTGMPKSSIAKVAYVKVVGA